MRRDVRQDDVAAGVFFLIMQYIGARLSLSREGCVLVWVRVSETEAAIISAGCVLLIPWRARLGHAPAFPGRDAANPRGSVRRLLCADTGGVDKDATRRRRSTGSSVRYGCLDRRLLNPILLDSGSWLCRFPSGFCSQPRTHPLGRGADPGPVRTGGSQSFVENAHPHAATAAWGCRCVLIALERSRGASSRR